MARAYLLLVILLTRSFHCHYSTHPTYNLQVYIAIILFSIVLRVQLRKKNERGSRPLTPAVTMVRNNAR